MEYNIGVFDSGKGGLSVLEELKKQIPNESYIYYGDKIHNPYGEKSDEELLKITTWIVENLKSRNCKVIVIACNTATTRCMKKLRSLFPDLIFIGTVPAIKVASDNNYKNTLVMSTASTTTSNRISELIRDFKRDDQNIYLVPCPGLADAIENDNEEQTDTILKNIYEQYKDKHIDSIVLGCTHYALIKDKINSYFKDVILLDGAVGVAKEVKRQLQIHNLNSNLKEEKVTILDSLN